MRKLQLKADDCGNNGCFTWEPTTERDHKPNFNLEFDCLKLNLFLCVNCLNELKEYIEEIIIKEEKKIDTN